MSLNEGLIQKRCQDIEDSLKRLEKIKEVNKDEFLKNRDLQDIASYRLLVAIESVLSLCYHVSAKKLKKAPGEYTECFILLADDEIISRDLSEKLKKMARFRNMLVHMYWKVEYEVVFDILQDSLDDLRHFSNAITALLKPQPEI
jgi:uncharacterized protein YutE (UPF0331/DUF86 family)